MLNLDHIKHLRQAALADKRYQEFVNLPATDMSRMIRSLPLAQQCVHLGERLTPEEGKQHSTQLLTLGVKCNSCSGTRGEFHCDKFKFTNMGKCTGCRDWKSKAAIFSRPAIKLDHNNFCPEMPELRLNPSIIASGDGYIFAWRHGWAGSDIFVVRMNADFQPVGEPKQLDLRRSGADFGREDSRLFRVNGVLHIMYIGVAKKFGPVNVLYARLNEETLEVDTDRAGRRPRKARWNPRIPGRMAGSWEKNHGYFEHDGVVHAIYSISPHRILEVRGRDAQFVHSTTPRIKWSGGRLSGGAAPVFHNGEWYHFFHGNTEWNGRRQYNMGVYTFEPKPPFRITRFTPHPIDVADPTVSHDNHCDVLFPGGAVKLPDEWLVAHGIHDRWSELRFYNAAWVESQLEKVK
jgi:predicted GH43/DUF377 family glycosyl hydrolase